MTNDTQQVAPALTPEEWAEASQDLYLRLKATADGAHFTDPPPEEMHQTMALANALLPDGDRRKITHADVTQLRRDALNHWKSYVQAKNLAQQDAMQEAEQAATLYSALADKLEGLLPPIMEG